MLWRSEEHVDSPLVGAVLVDCRTFVGLIFEGARLLGVLCKSLTLSHRKTHECGERELGEREVQ